MEDIYACSTGELTLSFRMAFVSGLEHFQVVSVQRALALDVFNGYMKLFLR